MVLFPKEESNTVQSIQSLRKSSCPHVSGIQTRPAISTRCLFSLSLPLSSTSGTDGGGVVMCPFPSGRKEQETKFGFLITSELGFLKRWRRRWGHVFFSAHK
ncbi:hypothetical protein HanXRQr2_Chr13g0570261 [Helianthus annuus]|nr:hypothetical protein HanXRQr2_Chr13g0570261 [Helianthus annuus]